MENSATRYLAVILSADVVDYSRHMAGDQESTIRAVGDLRRRVQSTISGYSGRLVDFTGDNFLAEFPAPADAVRFALHLQTEPGQLILRSGMHLGEVRAEDGLLFGDTVNIAARIQGLAEPGGVCVSSGVLTTIEHQLQIKATNLGTPVLKNLPQRVQVYQLELDLQVDTSNVATPNPVSRDTSTLCRIAVLPFETLTRSDEDEVLADGMTEDVIGLLSRLPGFHVISRTSTFAYKGRTQDVRQAAERLGVRYIVSGSVRRAGSRVRISAQLVDAEHGTQLWSERYDRTVDDIFAVQDEVTRAIAAQLMPELTAAEGSRARLEAPDNLDAWSYYQRALAERLRPTTRASLDETEVLLVQSIQCDPNFAPAHSFLGNVLATRIIFGWSKEISVDATRATKSCQRAAELAPYHPSVLHDRGVALGVLDKSNDGESLLLKSVELNPNNAHGWATLGYIAVRSRRPELGIEHVHRAIGLSPRDQRIYLWEAYLSVAHMSLEQFEEALVHAERSTRGFDGLELPWFLRTVALAKLGRSRDSQDAANNFRQRWPDITHASLRSIVQRQGPPVPEQADQLLELFWTVHSTAQ